MITEGRPEEWLNDVEAAMFAATKSTLFSVLEASKAMKKERWVKENQGQCIITAGQIIWTMECEKALSDAEAARKAVRLLKKKWVSYLNKLTTITRSKLNKIERNKARPCACPASWQRLGCSATCLQACVPLLGSMAEALRRCQ